MCPERAESWVKLGEVAIEVRCRNFFSVASRPTNPPMFSGQSAAYLLRHGRTQLFTNGWLLIMLKNT